MPWLVRASLASIVACTFGVVVALGAFGEETTVTGQAAQTVGAPILAIYGLGLFIASLRAWRRPAVIIEPGRSTVLRPRDQVPWRSTHSAVNLSTCPNSITSSSANAGGSGARIRRTAAS